MNSFAWEGDVVDALSSEQLSERAGDINREELMSSKDEKENLFKLAATFILLIVSVISFINNLDGNAFAALVVSILIFCSLNPVEAAKRNRGRLEGISSAFANSRFMNQYRKSVILLRRFFQQGDRLVRILMIFLAVGGSALLIKEQIDNFKFLIWPFDVILKRVGPASALSSLIIYPTYVMSKRVFELSALQYDKIIRRYEFSYYVSAVLFTITAFVFFSGYPVEGHVDSSMGNKYHKGMEYSDYALQVIRTIGIIWVIWWIALGSIIMLRFFDAYWRQRFEG